MNLSGEVVGVNAFVYEMGQNLNFAIPVDLVHLFLSSLEDPWYRHEPGAVAAVLQWEGEYGLDLEIWSAQQYVGSASWFGESPDLLQGGLGEEWFVFDGDFSSGRFVISPYFVGPKTRESLVATLTVVFPDGSTQVFSGNLKYNPPYDQWFALEIDVDREEVVFVDFFLD